MITTILNSSCDQRYSGSRPGLHQPVDVCRGEKEEDSAETQGGRCSCQCHECERYQIQVLRILWYIGCGQGFECEAGQEDEPRTINLEVTAAMSRGEVVARAREAVQRAEDRDTEYTRVVLANSA